MIRKSLAILTLAAAVLGTAAAQQPLLITTAPNLSDVRLGQPVSLALTARGGVPPYTWSLESGTLGGLSLTPAGQLVGYASNRASLTFKVVATDSAAPTHRSTARIFKLNILPALTSNSTGNFTSSNSTN
jgi:hypothetical protein